MAQATSPARRAGSGKDPQRSSSRKGKTHDSRSYVRVALAVAAPIPMAVAGAAMLFLPFGLADEFDTRLQHAVDSPGAASAYGWLLLPYAALMFPAILAVVIVARRGAPRLAAWGATVTMVGTAIGFAMLPNDQVTANLVVAKGLDAAAVGEGVETYYTLPLVQVSVIFWLVAVVIGSALLGLALWRSRAVPAWFGIALMVGGATHPFLPGNVGVGTALLVAAVGFAGASLALLRMSNDEFDLAPLAR
jgi:hypothetical protein